VASVVTALESHDRGHAVSEQIDDLAFAFIAPLSANDYDILLHGSDYDRTK
jgi:hypothetical protein